MTIEAWDHALDEQDSHDEQGALVLVKAYALGDRLQAPGFCRTTNNSLFDHRCSIDFGPKAILPVVKWAFANIPADRIILQFLTNYFCEDWISCKDNTEDVLALKDFPPEFVARVLRRFCRVKASTYNHSHYCYLEHASKKEAADCTFSMHAEFDEAMDYSFPIRTTKLKAIQAKVEAASL